MDSIIHRPEVGNANWSNQTIWTGDNLEIMRGMNSANGDLSCPEQLFNSKTRSALADMVSRHR